ncbi:MAG: translation initiation factor IF-2, partial [Deltaproteobacteria bacterium]|nr:translation initiation factor IF-2 [Deltaproteobacteria bacterium]
IVEEAAPAPEIEPEVETTEAAKDEPPEAKKAEKNETPVEAAIPEETVETEPEVTQEEKAIKPEKVKKPAGKKQEKAAKPTEKKTVKKTAKKPKKAAVAKIIKLPAVDEIKVEKEKPSPDEVPKEPVAPPKEEKETKKKKRKKRQEAEEAVPDKKFSKKKISFRKKEVVEGKDLYGGNRARGRKGRRGAKIKPVSGLKTQITTPKAIKRRIKIDDTIVLSDLSKRMGIKAGEMIQKLMSMGVMATVNQTIDFDTAVLVAAEFDFELEKAAFEEASILNVDKNNDDAPEQLVERPPVVTIMGHVDHGKTSLLDVIRKSSVTDLEMGGITQHIGAYNVETEKGQIVFLDTPGHEAFTAMRSRGASVTDIVILVVAADDGVMPQTIEAMNHAKSANVPIIVAVNKIDKENADPEMVKRGLSDYGILSEEWGGENIFVNISAKQKTGINELLDMILLQSEMLELKADPNKPARGHVIESKLDSGRGSVATILIQEGTLKAGASIVCGLHYGKVRAMLDDKGNVIEKATPSTPVEVLGLNGVPDAGEELVVIDDEKDAKQVSEYRIQKQRSKELAKSSRLSLEGLFEQMQENEVKDLNLIIKADVHGTIEALKESLIKLSGDEVKIKIIHSATGTINESDISLAAVSNAIIIGFNVRPATKIHDLASEENVDMRFYNIIYDAIKDIKSAMTGMMDSKFEERILGRAEIREVFVIPKVGAIAGSYVTDGKIERGQRTHLIRDGVVVHDGKIESLRRFKDDAKEVRVGYECGIGIEKFNDIKVNDEIECYYLEEIKPTME